ncbi:MAG: hypothetical protein AAF961_10260, partial [Planctomycetota bacterium]
PSGGHELILHRSGNIAADIVDDGGQPVSVTISEGASLSGSNSYTGVTHVNEGTVEFVTPEALPDGTDLFVSGGNVELEYETASKRFAGIRLAEGGRIEGDFSHRAPILFDRLDIEEGSVESTIAGTGPIFKTTIGEASITAGSNSR